MTALFLGIDLAWKTSAHVPDNDSGVVALTSDGTIVRAGWVQGVDAVASWIAETADNCEVVSAFVDASLWVENASGQRACEREVGQRYGRWKVSANSTNLRSPRQGGTLLRERLEAAGWRYHDGVHGPVSAGRTISECYPYTTLVGALELGYDRERPAYKRKPTRVPAALFREQRAATCDDLVNRVVGLRHADPPMDLMSFEVTRQLVQVPSPLNDRAYKKREDLLDAALCAWTASLWAHHGLERCQVLGGGELGPSGRRATIIAPARPEQRR